MGKLVCFKHPQYDGVAAPTLSCKTCCSIFVEKVKDHSSNEVDAYTFMQKKADEAKSARMRKNVDKYSTNFNPDLI